MKMTSTSFNVGLNDGVRSSSRVLRPPGGGHTDIFGGDPEPPRGRRLAPQPAGTNIHGHGDEPAKATNGDTPTQNGQASEPQPPQSLPEPTPAPKSTPERTPEARTPEAKTPEAKTPEARTPEAKIPETVTDKPQMEPPKRVRVPPGGFSSGLW